MNFELISLLADGAFHSGVELGSQLGISRAAVWKNISQLEKFGLHSETVRGVGYRLAEPLQLLSALKIADALESSIESKVEDFRILPSLDSTNDFVKSQMTASQGYTICLAEHQKAGRGRRGKCWESPYGKNLYLSLGLKFDGSFEGLNGLSLAVGVAVANTLAQFGLAVALKWPNDVWIDRKKVAGILVEVEGEQDGPLNLIIGIGVNVNMQENDVSIDQPWTSIAVESAGCLDRNILAARIINQLIEMTERFKREGFENIRDQWDKYDGLSGRRVILTSFEKTEPGICRGVDKRGYLLLESDGKVRSFAGGELSLRAAT
jgi:BirA family transcriptional regulator, biotin operon repressor / biotin---[acetyl-CoA-carboxylase] ligase